MTSPSPIRKLLIALILGATCCGADQPRRRTAVSIDGDAFLLNGAPTYAGRSWRGHSIEGLLLNARLVQGIFDDLNAETRKEWAYPDSGNWDAERNTREFVAAMPQWRSHGLLAFTLNLQGGCPRGYCRSHPYHNSAFTSTGDLRPEYMARLRTILDRADELGMVVILGLYYFGQDQRLADEAAVQRGVDQTVDWLFDGGYTHVLIEVNNECNVGYEHAVLRPDRVHELIKHVKSRTRGARRLLVSTSLGGGSIPNESIVREADFLLLHGNGVGRPALITDMIRRTRRIAGYRPMPILFNEDDHFEFDQPRNNLTAAIAEHCSWGYFDPGKNNYTDGYQCPPVNWGINTERKQAFFRILAEITQTEADSRPAATQTAQTAITIPTVDLSKDKQRQVIVESKPGQYLGHPTTVLLADRRTILAVYPLGHGGPAAVLKKSEDGGLTWSERLPVPANWATATNCPCIHRLTGPDGIERLFVFEGNGAMRQSVSLDNGRTWTPFVPNGLHCVVAPITIVEIAGKRHLAIYQRGRNDKDASPQKIWQSVSSDGGLTWSPERMVCEVEGADPCEPAVVRSPDGKQLACLMRENRRRFNSMLMLSDDDGRTWSQPVELPKALTGDRHLPRYSKDGRLVIPFRDMGKDSPTYGRFVAWVGTYDDLVRRREGQYRILLLDSPRRVDLGYPGLELLPDNTFVATTYAVLAPGEKNSVVSIRFKLDETDARAH